MGHLTTLSMSKNGKLIVGLLVLALVIGGAYAFTGGDSLQGRFTGKTANVGSGPGPRGALFSKTSDSEDCDGFNMAEVDGECVELLADLEVTSLSIVEVDSKNGEVTIDMMVTNIGDGEGIMAGYAFEFTRYFQDGSGGGGNVTGYDDRVISSGQSLHIYENIEVGDAWIDELSAGASNELWLTGSVDTKNKIDEEDEGNNSLFEVMTVSSADL